MNKYAKSMYIDAIQWAYGFTKAKATNYMRKYIREGNVNTLNMLVEGFRRNAKANFYED